MREPEVNAPGRPAEQAAAAAPASSSSAGGPPAVVGSSAAAWSGAPAPLATSPSASSGGGAASSAAPAPNALDAVPELPNPEDVRDTDMLYFHAFATFEPKVPTEKIRGIADAILGKVEIHKQKNEVTGEFSTVVMKKMKTEKVEECARRSASGRSETAAEDALTEIGTLIYLSTRGECDSLLRLIGSFRDDRFTWLATEHCDAELFNVVSTSPPMGEGQVQVHMQQLLQAVGHLHRHNVGHRDISLENILLKGGRQLKLMDLGQAVLCRTRDGRKFRYFRIIGKPYYRSPEVYSPGGKFQQMQVRRPVGETGAVVQVRPQDANSYLCEVRLPEGLPGEVVTADLAGYEVEPLDMFAVGVCMFILYCRVPPWKMALLSDGGFKYTCAKGVAALFQAWRVPMLSPPGMQLLQSMLEVSPADRCGLQQALESAWLSPPVPAALANDAAADAAVVDGTSAAVSAMSLSEAAAAPPAVGSGGARTNGTGGGSPAAASAADASAGPA